MNTTLNNTTLNNTTLNNTTLNNTTLNNTTLNNSKIIEYTNKIDVDLDAAKLDFEKYNLDFDLEVKTTEELTAKQYLLIIPITKFFKNARNIFILYNLLKCKTAISLRLIEFFVVNYVLENNTCYDLNRYKNNPRFLIDNLFDINKKYSDYKKEEFVNNTINDTSFILPTYNELFMIHDNYKCKLKEYNKKNFDPFCRWERVTLTYEKKTQLHNEKLITVYEKSFETTVAQLTFFKWAIENYIIDYITEYFDDINNAMLKFEEETKLEKEKKKIRNKIKYDNINNVLQADDINEYSYDSNKKTKKKEIIYCNADKKTIKKQRTKKEFTKTNKSIIKYNNEKELKFK